MYIQNIEKSAIGKLLDVKPKELAMSLLDLLLPNENVISLYILGSLVNGTVDQYSDVDLIIAARNGQKNYLANLIKNFVDSSDDILFYGKTDKYPWFGSLHALYWRTPFLFAIDIGIKEERELCVLPLQSQVVALKNGSLNENLGKPSQPDTYLPQADAQQAEYTVFNLLAKTRKSLHRGHLWNAFEYVSQLRRVYLQLLREAQGKPVMPRTARPERDIESVLSNSECVGLAESIPQYSTESMLRIILRLATQIMSHYLTQSWKDRDAIQQLIKALLTEFYEVLHRDYKSSAGTDSVLQGTT